MTEEVESAKDLLISKITSAPVLRMYDGKKELRVITDASLLAVAAILEQKEDNGVYIYGTQLNFRAEH